MEKNQKLEKIASLKEVLSTNQEVIENALLTLYSYQTEEERLDKETKESNSRGFNAFDSKTLTKMAEWVKSGKSLSGYHLEKAKKMLPKYAKQLVEIQADNIEDKTKCPKCNNLSLQHEVDTFGCGDEYDIKVHTQSCPCGYGDSDVY